MMGGGGGTRNVLLLRFSVIKIAYDPTLTPIIQLKLNFNL